MSEHSRMPHFACFARFLRCFGLHPKWMGVLLLSSLSLSARADVWGYIDEKGVSHFAAEQVDARYELFFRGNTTLQIRDGALAPAVPARVTARPVSVPTDQPRLVAYFEVAPGFRTVKHVLREASITHNIDYELLKALIATESGFDASAVSPKGAVGLMQVMPATAGRFGVVADKRATVEQKLADPATNIRTGVRYLSYLIQLFPGQLELALAAYNAGEGAVQRAGNRIPNYKETQNYVSTVMQLYALLKPPASLAPQPAGGRIRVTLPVAVAGGAIGRAGVVSSSTAVVTPVAAAPRDTFYR